MLAANSCICCIKAASHEQTRWPIETHVQRHTDPPANHEHRANVWTIGSAHVVWLSEIIYTCSSYVKETFIITQFQKLIDNKIISDNTVTETTKASNNTWNNSNFNLCSRNLH